MSIAPDYIFFEISSRFARMAGNWTQNF